MEIVIVSALRTAIGNLNGSLSTLPAHKLSEYVIKEILTQTNVATTDVSEVILGQVLTAGMGQNPARQAAIGAAIAHSTPSYLVNQVCGSGLKAIALGYEAIFTGRSSIVIAGGQESMSQAPHAIQVRNGIKMGNSELIDTMIKDGLTDAFENIHMGLTAENIAKQFNISRHEQDEFAVRSHNKAEIAQKEGKFKDEIVPIIIKNKKGDIIVDKDEFIRPQMTIESISTLRPAFLKDGSVTAASSSGINDGAACVMLMTKEEALKRGLKPLGFIRGFTAVGVNPSVMGTGPISASKLALEKVGWKHEELNLIEANEAFAAQAICVNTQMTWDTNKVNVNGGAIALGHPIGASGARIIVTLIHEMNKRKAKKGLATLCVGGGMGVAMCIEN